jgi:hypothetical protein
MKRCVVLGLICVSAVISLLTVADAQISRGGYSVCMPCHNGRTAPDLRGLFSSTDELIRTAKSVRNPMMRNIQENDELLRAAAKDLGLK